jgi:hypothetical protein
LQKQRPKRLHRRENGLTSQKGSLRAAGGWWQDMKRNLRSLPKRASMWFCLAMASRCVADDASRALATHPNQCVASHLGVLLSTICVSVASDISSPLSSPNSLILPIMIASTSH